MNRDTSHPLMKMRPRGSKKHWIQGAVKHPGALTAAASAHGISKSEEASRESHSSDPHIRARGILGKRFMKHQI